MNLVEQTRFEISRTINTLHRRFATTTDRGERKIIERVIRSLNRQLSMLNQAQLLDTASVVAEATTELEKAVAAAKTSPFNGYLAALEEHFQHFFNLLGELQGSDRLGPAPDEEGPIPRAAAAERASTGLTLPAGLSPPVNSRDFAELRAEYQAYYEACTPKPDAAANIEFYIRNLNRHRPVYEAVGSAIGRLPWALVGVIHGMECGFNFATHLHNGDPLRARTVHVPANRPVVGSPPFTWNESAVDALRMEGYNQIEDWSIPRMLYLLEKYNGFGYRPLGVPTPYLWSFSNLYERGKFTADRHFDPHAVSKQCGAAVMLKVVLGEA